MYDTMYTMIDVEKLVREVNKYLRDKYAHTRMRVRPFDAGKYCGDYIATLDGTMKLRCNTPHELWYAISGYLAGLKQFGLFKQR